MSEGTFQLKVFSGRGLEVEAQGRTGQQQADEGGAPHVSFMRTRCRGSTPRRAAPALAFRLPRPSPQS